MSSNANRSFEVQELATFDTGDWKEVARLDLEPPGTLAVFQRDSDEAVRCLIFRRTHAGFWECQHRSGHYPSVEEAVADVVRWRG